MTSARRPARGRLAEAAAALPALLGLTCLGAAAIACGPPPAPRTANDADLRSVPEGRALAIAREALADAGFQAGPGFAVDIGREAPLEVDLPMNPAALLAFQFLMMHWVEIRRWMDIRTPGSANQDPIFSEQKLTTVDPGYPGGPFDPLGFSKVR